VGLRASMDMAVRVKLSMSLINYAPRDKGVWRSGGIQPPFFTFALDGGEWSASCPWCFIPRETAPSIHCLGGWVGPQVGADVMDVMPEIEPCFLSHPAHSLVSTW
jgi:hypothetical protein